MTQPHARLSKVARNILGYLERNPHAGDTLEGVVQWWVPQQRIHEAVQQVQHALDRLVKLGLVSRRRATPHGPVLYSAIQKNKTRRKPKQEKRKRYEISE